MSREAERAETPPEPVAWQVRWTNPGNNPASRDEESMWKPVEPDWRIDQTMEQKVAELRSYRYEGKPCYEVRALYATPPERAETPPERRTFEPVWSRDTHQAVDAMEKILKAQLKRAKRSC